MSYMKLTEELARRHFSARHMEGDSVCETYMGPSCDRLERLVTDVIYEMSLKLIPELEKVTDFKTASSVWGNTIQQLTDEK